MRFRKPRTTLTFALAAGLLLSQAHNSALADDGSVDSLWNDQAPVTQSSGSATGGALCTLDSFKQSALVVNGAWPGMGPFRGDAPQLVDANQNKLTVSVDKARVTGAELTIPDKPRQLVKLQIVTDFMLESLGAPPARIADFNAQLAKAKPELPSSTTTNPLSISSGRYVVSIYPESATKDMVNFVVRVSGKEGSGSASTRSASSDGSARTAPIIVTAPPERPARSTSRPESNRTETINPRTLVSKPVKTTKPVSSQDGPDSDLPANLENVNTTATAPKTTKPSRSSTSVSSSTAVSASESTSVTPSSTATTTAVTTSKSNTETETTKTSDAVSEKHVLTVAQRKLEKTQRKAEKAAQKAAEQRAAYEAAMRSASLAETQKTTTTVGTPDYAPTPVATATTTASADTKTTPDLVPATQTSDLVPAPNAPSRSALGEWGTTSDTTKVATAIPAKSSPAQPVEMTVLPAPTGSATTSGDTLKSQFINVITKWQQIKSAAVNKKDASALPQVLGGRALAKQTDAIKWLETNKKHYDLFAKNVNIDRYNELSKDQKYAVFAQVTEASKYIDDLKNQVLKDTTETYNVNYTIEKVDDHWAITDSAIIPPATQAATKTSTSASR